jgi:hypothetical protein
VIQDRAQLSNQLMSEGVAERLRQILRGRVEIWRKIGLRYRAEARWAVDLKQILPMEWLTTPDETGEPLPLGRLLALCDLLYDLASLAGVTPPAPSASPAESSESPS